MITYAHSGDAGDLVYALPVIRALGRGESENVLYLKAQPPFKVREPFNAAKMEWLKPLLLAQPYIQRVELWNGEGINHDLDRFRIEFFHDRRAKAPQDWQGKRSIAEYCLRAFNLPMSELDTPWLTVKRFGGSGAIINRTRRYRNPMFPWLGVMSHLIEVGNPGFIGTAEEHQDFFGQMVAIPLPTPTAEAMASVIGNSAIFIGNQSLPLAIAHGLHHPVIVEQWPYDPNCKLRRMNATYFLTPRADTGNCLDALRYYTQRVKLPA